jgi:pyrimidine-nucleoside phosphorylase
MNMPDVIQKKRDGGELSRAEIDFFVQGFTAGTIPDYQAAALLMAMFLRKLNLEETYHLTEAMRLSGESADLSAIPGIKVDKHSTGGVGDKTTLVVAPLAAACGVPIAKMSGRGLGFTGGTIDKLEAIPGFQTAVAPTDFLDQIGRIGLAVVGQTARIAPADKKIYALRDVTATVDDISLITASIMSKKLASGSDAIVLDVKCGKGAFMEDMESAGQLARMMVDMGRQAGKKTIALITDANQPLGQTVGNSLEVIEAIETLKGAGPADITELSLVLAGYMIYAGEKADTPEAGRKMAEAALADGRALAKLRQLITAQGGDPAVIDDYSRFPQPANCLHIYASSAQPFSAAYVTAINARRIGLASQHSGAGRIQKDDPLDLSAGIRLLKKVGDPVKADAAIAVLYGNDIAKLEAAAGEVRTAFTIETAPPKDSSLLILDVIE